MRFKFSLIKTPLAIFFAAVTLSGCVAEVSPAPVAPGGGSVWVPGHYNRYRVWTPGHYMPRNSGAVTGNAGVWVPGFYNRWGGWVPGHWR